MSPVPKTDCVLCQWKLEEIYRHRVRISVCPFLCPKCHNLRSAIVQHDKSHCRVCQESVVNRDKEKSVELASIVLSWRKIQGILFCLLCSAAEQYLLKESHCKSTPLCDKCRIIHNRVKERRSCMAEELYFNPLSPVPEGYYRYHDMTKCPDCVIYRFLISHPGLINASSIFYRA